MGESVDSSQSQSESFFRKHWEGYKEFWTERFSFLDNYSRFVKRDHPLPSWSDADVEQFIASDTVHGPTLRTAREAVKYGATGSVIGAVSTAAFAWKYSRSLHGTVGTFQYSLYFTTLEQILIAYADCFQTDVAPELHMKHHPMI
ncbi:succinate dehydrogenase subunit 6, mitochondrial isoform X2 [Actinidia eriantha]|uniref:succinate dehydrogenase subunit 6, mitochondrial isoform X2 n=1 Tax=Actinidia eriantha TaxID=165200 RepID=UPI00258AF79B|nr:succinate dehydrogenase subunit 6, mitochondrial isoform X2 [Actinidia eriantha]